MWRIIFLPKIKSKKGEIQMKEIQIGNQIALKRKKKGITQEQLANFLNVSVPAISKWESGKCYPDLTFLPLLAAYFQISIDELVCYVPS